MSYDYDNEREMPDLDYDDDIFIKINDVKGDPWQILTYHGNTSTERGFSIMLYAEDESAMWEVDIGNPYVVGYSSYDAPTRDEPGGYNDVSWARDGSGKGISFYEEELKMLNFENSFQL